MIRETVTIEDPNGLHARRARELVERITDFNSSVTLRHDGNEADGRSIMEVMMLAASPGSEVEIVVDGSDETDAMERLESFFKDENNE